MHITIGTTGFSRGAATARDFLNTVWNNGIPDTSSRVSLGRDPISNQERFAYTRYLVQPETADLGVAMLYDTVATGVVRQESLQRIPPTPGLQVYQIYAEDEHRSAFTLDSIVDPGNPDDPRMHQWGSPGAHSDIAGYYTENGIALKTLEIGRNLLKNSGVPLAELPAALQYNGQALTIHDSFKGMYGPDAGPQSGGYVSESRLQHAKTYDNPGALTGRAIQSFDDGSKIETLTYADGSKEVINRNGTWQVLRSTTSTYNSDGSLHSREVVLPQADGSQTTERYNGTWATNTTSSRSGAATARCCRTAGSMRWCKPWPALRRLRWGRRHWPPRCKQVWHRFLRPTGLERCVEPIQAV
ncbi:hypothetical protein [Polaromonas sp. YR568]|uniref:hypothetical protein n=1 Tax=Polaromonas sp. YR568 TaxID=1855301 RepID=UPI00398BF188